MESSKDKTIRVAIFGIGPTVTEWDMPAERIDVLPTAKGADVLVVHGPLTPSNWPRFEAWLAQRSPEARLLGVGHEVSSHEGMLLDPWSQPSGHRLDGHLCGVAASPHTFSHFVRNADV